MVAMKYDFQFGSEGDKELAKQEKSGFFCLYYSRKAKSESQI